MFATTKELAISTAFTLRHLADGSVPPIVSDLLAEGFSCQNDAIAEEQAVRLRNEVDELLERSSINVWRDDTGSDLRIYGYERVSELVGGVLDVPRITELGSQYVGRSLASYFIMANRLQYQRGNLGSGGGWHRDSAFSHQFKAIFYLSNVGVTNGPFEYVPASHLSRSKFGVRRHIGIGDARITESQISKCKLQSVAVTGSAGTGLYADTRGIHRGRPIEEGVRYALTIYFFPAEVPSQFKDLLQR